MKSICWCVSGVFSLPFRVRDFILEDNLVIASFTRFFFNRWIYSSLNCRASLSLLPRRDFPWVSALCPKYATRSLYCGGLYSTFVACMSLINCLDLQASRNFFLFLHGLVELNPTCVLPKSPPKIQGILCIFLKYYLCNFFF